MFKAINTFMKGLLNYLGQWWRFFGRMLIAIGSVVAGYRYGQYKIVTRIIETTLRSALIQMEVYAIKTEHPLYVSFIVHVRSAYSNKIDWLYFRLELMLQLGCGFTDISCTRVGTSEGSEEYKLDITRTALSNLELGRSESPPDLFEERDTHWRLTRALEIAKTRDLTPEILEAELEITPYHAQLLYSQITKSDALPKQPKGKLMN